MGNQDVLDRWTLDNYLMSIQDEDRVHARKLRRENPHLEAQFRMIDREHKLELNREV